MKKIKYIINRIIIKLMEFPILSATISTVVLLFLMQFTILFDVALLILNFVLVYQIIMMNKY
jgi:hypothetical protein